MVSVGQNWRLDCNKSLRSAAELVPGQRASNGLVKVISSKTGSDGDHVPQTSSSCISPLVVLGKSLSASVLQIWFPAHWAVRVETRLSSLRGTTSEYRAEHTQTHVPNVRCNIKLPGQSIDVEHLLQRFPTVLRGIVQGVFRQQAGGAWFLQGPQIGYHSTDSSV